MSDNPSSSSKILEFIQPFLIDPTSIQQTLFYNGFLLQKGLAQQITSPYALQLTIPKNDIIVDPIYIVHITKPGSDPDLTPLTLYPKNFILLEENAKATVIEIVIALGEASSHTHTVTNIKLAKGAEMNHIFLQRSLSQSLQLAEIHIAQSSQSHYTGTTITLGGETNQTAFCIDLNEPQAHCEFYALTSAYHQQKTNVNITVQHHKPNAQSSMMTRGIIKDKAKSAFTGKIVVQEKAIQSKAFLENKNLLLSALAEASTRPELEIYNNDVQCSHGATVGHLDLDALFYLKSRGIPEKDAKQLLIDSFIAPSLQGLSPSLQTYVADLIHEH